MPEESWTSLPVELETTVRLDQAAAPFRARHRPLRGSLLVPVPENPPTAVSVGYELTFSKSYHEDEFPSPSSPHELGMIATETIIGAEAQQCVSEALSLVTFVQVNPKAADDNEFIYRDGVFRFQPGYLQSVLEPFSGRSFTTAVIKLEVISITFSSPLKIRSKLLIVTAFLSGLSAAMTATKDIATAMPDLSCGIAHIFHGTDQKQFRDAMRANFLTDLTRGAQSHDYRPLQRYLRDTGHNPGMDRWRGWSYDQSSYSGLRASLSPAGGCRA
jgi:hypothetical protein